MYELQPEEILRTYLTLKTLSADVLLTRENYMALQGMIFSLIH